MRVLPRYLSRKMIEQQSIPVDPRFLLANERTLLAWIRTALGLMALGFVVARSGTWIQTLASERVFGQAIFRWVGTALVVLAVATVVMAYRSYSERREALLAGRHRPPGGRTAAVLTWVLTIVGIAVAVALAVLPG